MLKPELQVKFLNHLNRRNKKDEGFTLIELLVVVIIIGVLAAIALPSLLSQVSKARQSEAKQNVGSMNRAQQAFFLENNNAFTTSLQELALGIRSATENYIYNIEGVTGTNVTNKGRARKSRLKSYAGSVYTSTQLVNTINEAITLAQLFESNTPANADNTNGETVANAGNNGASAPTGMKEIK
jgi:type IV pilus assembly protein PilA